MKFTRKEATTYFNDEWHKDLKAKPVDIFSPQDGEVIGKRFDSTIKQLDEIVKVASKAQKEWSKLTFKKRAFVMYRYLELLREHRIKLAELVHLDNGKSPAEAQAEVDKCIELTEFAVSIPQIISGESQWVSKGILAREERRPIGVVGVVTPFNFPLMVPHWSIPNAIATGNAVILKPSQLTPLATSYMAELFQEAGLPKGLFSLVFGEAEIGQAIAKHPDIQGMTFVGSSPVAKAVYTSATSTNKRVLALGGAKNHVFALKDTPTVPSAKQILSSAVGMAGQRCMALSVLLVVGKNDALVDEMVKQARGFRLGYNFPAIVSQEAIAKLKAYTIKAREIGAKVLIDGATDYKIEKSKINGYWYGPTLIDWTGLEDKMPDLEVFGPVLEIIRTKNISEAIAIQHKSPYGNAASIFTQSGLQAEKILAQMNPGMLGVNIGVPVPREPFSFGGTGLSKFGYGDITGKSSLNFWTTLHKITIKWDMQAEQEDWMS